MTDELHGLIARALGASDAERFVRFQLKDVGVLTQTARSLLSLVAPMPGACLMLSASWALFLREKHAIPAVAVAGDLKVRDEWIFRGTDALPSTGRNENVVRGKWRGHCWIEVSDFVGDLSLFRTAYALLLPLLCGRGSTAPSEVVEEHCYVATTSFHPRFDSGAGSC